MEPDADLAAIGRLIGDPNRARILQVLMGGTPQSGSALAEAAGISRSLASAHLKQLTAGGLVRAERRGRQQLYSLASGQVAEALETLQLLAPARPVRSLRGSTRMRNLRWARMCYDHLAGVTGVAVTEGLTARDAIGGAGRRLGARPGRRAGVRRGRYRRRPACRAAPGRCCGPAWTGPSGGTISPAASAPRSAPSSLSAAGCAARRAAVSSR